MSDGEHLDAIRQLLLEHQVIRKSGCGQLSRFASHERNARPRARKCLNQLKSSLRFASEPISNFRVSIAVPSGRVAKLLPSGGLNENWLQRRSTLVRISSSTTRQSSPRSPAASRERRSISAAQALWTSSSDPSRLASSSAASAARSSGSSSSACFRRWLVASVTRQFYNMKRGYLGAGAAGCRPTKRYTGLRPGSVPFTSRFLFPGFTLLPRGRLGWNGPNRKPASRRVFYSEQQLILRAALGS